ncbi:MAG: 4'-phosphopantetheinyl transferase superfamily protein [Steroidobacteraceae bacterium]
MTARAQDAALRIEPLAASVLLMVDAPLRVGAGAVHLWAFQSGRGTVDAVALRERCVTLLDDGERARAARFLFEDHQHDYIVFHALLRSVLARYLGALPSQLRFTQTAQGKPLIEGLEFNLSHSADRALLAVTASDPVGADLEMERDDLDALALADRYFYGAELATVQAAASESADAGRRSFFRHWVAKEAVLKGVGVGLGFPLDRFGVHFSARGGSARIVSLDAAQVAPDWCLRMLEIGERCPGAVALRCPDFTLLACDASGALRAA